MMDPEDLQSDLFALRRLYRLLINNGHHIEDVVSENLDNNARRLLMNLLDTAANRAFDAHTKILGTEFRTTYKPRSTPQQQSRDRPLLQPFSQRTPPTDGAYTSLQNVDYLTGEGFFNEPTNQVDPAGEPGVRLKRLRVCQTPKVKQLIGEISFGDNKALTSVNILQSHKRSWEDQNDPATVGGSASALNSPLTFDFFKSLSLTNSTVQEDHISREASSKILQLDSCISSLQVAAKHASFVKNTSENLPQSSGSTSLNIWNPIDMGHQWHDQTTRSTNELTLQDPWVNTILPSSQRVEEPAVNKIEMFNRYDLKREEAYYPSHSGGHMENQYDHITEEGYYPNLEKTADKNRVLHRNLAGQINRQQLDQLQMTKTEAVSETNEWFDSVGYGRQIKKQQEGEFERRKKPVYNEQMDDYRGKHEVPEPNRLVYDAALRLPDSPASGSNYSTQDESQSVSQSQSSNSFSDSWETYSGSSRSGTHETSESDVNSGSSLDESPSGSFESWGSMSRMVHKRGYKKGDPKRKGVAKINTVRTWDQNSSTSSSSEESSGSRSMVRKRGHKKGHQKEPVRKSRNKSPSMSSISSESSSSMSRTVVHEKGHKKGHQKEPMRDQTPSASSGSSESSVSNSRKTAPRKGNDTEPNTNELGRLSKLKDKLAVIFHNHHHHHHHHHHDDNDDENNDKKTIWKQAKTVISHSSKKKDEAHGKLAVKKTHGDQVAVKSTHGDLVAVKSTHGDQVAVKKTHGDQVAVKSTHGDLVVVKKTHGDQVAVKSTDGDQVAAKKTHGEEAVKKMEEMAIAVHKGEVKKQKQKQQLQLQALVGGLLKKTSHHSLKPSKSKSVVKSSPSGVSGQKQKHDGGNAKMGPKMQWLQMLRQQRKIKRIEKLRGKIDLGKKR